MRQLLIVLFIPTPQASLAGQDTNPIDPGPSDKYYLRTTPEKVCYNEVVTVMGKLNSYTFCA